MTVQDRRLQCWPGTFAERKSFQRDASRRYPTLRGQSIRDGFRYTLMVPVAGYGTDRAVRIVFAGFEPAVFVDGPTASPHRYRNGSLCMWYPPDPPDRRWCFDDGLPELINHIALHLFREAWWRETGGLNGGEWCGDEAPHGERAR